MVGWKTILSFWELAHFQVRLLLLSGSVKQIGNRTPGDSLNIPFSQLEIPFFSPWELFWKEKLSPKQNSQYHQIQVP